MFVEHNRCISSHKSHLFITSQQNHVAVKVEDDVVIEENSIDVKTDEFHAPSACSVKEVEPKVSFGFS
jgi:hypothetical protein